MARIFSPDPSLEPFRDDESKVAAAASSEELLSHMDVDSLLIRVPAGRLSSLSSRWILSNRRRGSKIIDKNPRLLVSLQVRLFLARNFYMPPFIL
jgi:hypothetical protein